MSFADEDHNIFITAHVPEIVRKFVMARKSDDDYSIPFPVPTYAIFLTCEILGNTYIYFSCLKIIIHIVKIKHTNESSSIC